MELSNNASIKFLDIKINSKDGLLRVFDIIHDGTVREEEVVYNDTDKTLDILIERGYLEDKNTMEIKHVFPFIRKYSYPIIKSHLHLSNLASFDKESIDSSLRAHTFNECRTENNKYFLIFCEVLKIKLSFLNNILFGFMKDVEVVKDKRFTLFSFSWKP